MMIELNWKEVFSGYDTQHHLSMFFATLVVVETSKDGEVVLNMHIIKQKGVHLVESDNPLTDVDEAKQMVLEAYVDLLNEESNKFDRGGYAVDRLQK